MGHPLAHHGVAAVFIASAIHDTFPNLPVF
jgi:hypothetical protein